MPYGQGTKIGEGFNPAIGLMDYSPMMRSNEIANSTMANSISGVIRDVSDERKRNKQQITSSKQTAKAIAQLIPELGPVLDEQIAMMDDEEMPLSQRAGVASAITDILNLGTAEIKSRAMMGMEMKRLQLDEMDTNSIVNARNFATNDAIDQRQIAKEVTALIAPARFNALIKTFQSSPETKDVFTSEYLDKAKGLRPEAQMALAETMLSLLPPKEAAKFVPDFMINADGINAKIPGIVENNTFYPTQIAGQDAPLAPPDGIMPQGNPADGEVLPPRIMPGNIQGQDPLSPTEEIAVRKYADDQEAKQQAAGATAAKTERTISLLDQLERHPGFSDLFGATWKPGARKVPGTNAASAEVLLDQIDAQGFLVAIQDMKGMGALSNAEGEKVSAALMGIKPKMKEKEAKAKIAEIKAYLSAGMQRMQSGNLVNPDGTPQTREATPAEVRTNATSRLRGLPK